MIIVGIVVLLLVLFAFDNSGPGATNLGVVTLETGYPQVIFVPEKPEYTKFEVSPPDLLAVSLDDGDAEIAELRATDANFNIIKVVPGSPGEGTITIRGQRDYVISVRVIPRQKEDEPYADELAKAKSPDTPDDVKEKAARLWLQEAGNIVYERPYVALERLDVAEAYAGRDLARDLELAKVRASVQDILSRQWQGLRLRYSQAAKQADLNDRAAVLKSMMTLIPDKRDFRYQWAKINLERTNYAIAQQRRPAGPWGG